MFYYSVFLGNLDFVIATVMANSTNHCSFMQVAKFFGSLWHIELKPPTDLPSSPTMALRWLQPPLWPYCWPFTWIHWCPVRFTLCKRTSQSSASNLSGSCTFLHQPTVLCLLLFIRLFGAIHWGEGESREDDQHGGSWDQHHLASAILWWQFIGTTTLGQLLILHFFFFCY